jgi:hypothetical protein
VEVISVKPLEYFWEKFSTDDDITCDEWQQAPAAEMLGE